MSTPARTPPPSPTRDKSPRARRLGIFHRITGLCFALPFLLLVLTGVPLQFTSSLKLGYSGVTWDWVHRAYGVSAPESARISNDVVQIGETLLWNNRHVATESAMVGARVLEMATIVVTASEILLIPADPRAAVERNAAPGRVRAFGETPAFDLILDTDQGLLESSDLGASWYAANIDSITWHEAETIPATPAWQRRYRAAQISWERWLMDLHSGRFFGPAGEWVMTLASFALVLLALTGFYVWLRGRAAPRV